MRRKTTKNRLLIDRRLGGRTPRERAPRTRYRITVAAVCGLLVLAIIIIFAQTAGHEFVSLDDNHYVYENPHVLGGLSREGIYWAFTSRETSAQWQPLTLLSLMVDVQLHSSTGGLPDLARLAAGMHLTNVALHAANTLVLFFLVLAMTRRTHELSGDAAQNTVGDEYVWRSALVAAIFATHPLHVESVAWITERKDVLSGLIGLLALWAYVGYTRRPGLVRYLAVTAALAAGLMCKPTLVTWPLVFMILDWPLARKRSASSLLIEKVPWFLLVAASSAVAFLAQRAGNQVTSLESVSIPARLARAAWLYVAYLGETFWPGNLAVQYMIEPAASYLPALGAVALLALLTCVALWGAHRTRGTPQRWITVGWLWFLIALLPTIGLVQVGTQVMADRFMYLPQIGLCLALVWGLAELARLWHCPRWSLSVTVALALAGFTVCAWRQTSYWKDTETLWTRALDCNPRNAFAHYNVANVLNRGGKSDEAISHYRQALQIRPDYFDARNNLGAALARAGQLDEAIEQFNKVLDHDPDAAETETNLRLAMARRTRRDEAISSWRNLLKADPANQQVLYALAWIDATSPEARLRDGKEAVKLAEKLAATQKQPQAKVLDALAAAYAEAGRFPEAAETARKARSAAESTGDIALIHSLNARIELYEAGKPYRDSK
jgi:tetratricopeptide (TPR) repeat protein